MTKAAPPHPLKFAAGPAEKRPPNGSFAAAISALAKCFGSAALARRKFWPGIRRTQIRQRQMDPPAQTGPPNK